MFDSLSTDWRTIGLFIILSLAAVIVATVLNHFLFSGLRRLAERSKSLWEASLSEHCLAPVRLLFIGLSLDLALPIDHSSPQRGTVSHLLSLFLIVSIAWLLMRLTFVAEEVIQKKSPLTANDNYQARGVYTQVHILRKSATVVIGVLTAGAVLMTFPEAESLGASLLASAGIAGIVIGMATRPTLENLLAGIQIAITQPIRIEDVVIVEGQWGWIEEITTTYVVVRIWNLERLILPISYFTQKAFQNWTRNSSALIGTVHLYADYTLPVQKVREELLRICQGNEKWNAKTCVLQVTHATENAQELRALVSADNSSILWDLRCIVREGLIDFIQREYPQCLPKVRAKMDHGDPMSPEPSLKGDV